MKVGSLFAGIGGLDLGLERAGMTVVWQVEIDDYCNRVLAKHWPDVVRFRDVRNCGEHNLPAVDLICGGFPCQDVSLAGTRAGLEGKRSTLWSEFHRIICEIKPRWVLAENVPGLLSSDDGRFFGNVLRDLATSGYDAEWDCIPAAAVGAPHQRDRIFIVAYPRSKRLEANYYNAMVFTKAVDAQNNGYIKSVPGTIVFPYFPSEAEMEAEPSYVGVDYGLPCVVDRLRGLGNSVVPQVAEHIGRLIMQANDEQVRMEGER